MARCLIFVLLAATASPQVTIKGVTITGVNISTSPCGAPNFCSPTNANVDQTSAPAALLGLTGVGASTTDAATGNLIIRATDYSLNGGGSTSAAFRANSDSNDNVWSIDDKMVGICRTGGGLYIDAFDPVGRTVTPKGFSGQTKGGCDLVHWSHVTSGSWFYSQGSIFNQNTVNTSSGTWTGSTGGNTDLTAAINTTNLLDVSSGCPGLAFNRYMSVSTLYGLDSADRWLSFGLRYAQDEGFQAIQFDNAGGGCHWSDSRSMTQGGAWGGSGSLTFANSVLLPAPAAPTLTATTGGSLAQAHQYTVCIKYVKAEIGRTPCSSNASITVNNPNNAISVTPPTATPANTVSKAGGFNVYVCDNTVSPGCIPTQQTNGTNASGALAMPTGLAAACTSNCSGAVSYTFWVYAINAGGQSPTSAPVTIASLGNNAVVNVSFTQVTNAATYTVLTDFQYSSNARAQAGSCVAGTCTISVNTNPNSSGYNTLWNQTVPIATTPVITSLTTTDSDAANDTTNTTGIKWHDMKNDGSGAWQMLTVSAVSIGNIQSSYVTDSVLFLDVSTGTALWGSNTSTPALNAGKICVGHHVLGWSTYMGFDCNTGNATRWVLNDSSATTEASQFYFVSGGFGAHGASDVHYSAQMQYQNSNFPWYIGSDGSGYASHAVPATYLTLELWGLQNQTSVSGGSTIWKFCQNWESGLQGFNSQVSGNISPDGKFILFSSDMGVGVGVTSGQLGNTYGGASCTDNTNCRTDAYICITR